MLRTVHGKANLMLEDTPLGSGGEGDVFRILEPKQHTNDVAKLLKPEKIDPSKAETKERQQKLEYLIDNPPKLLNLHSVIWPTDLVQNNNRFCGYIMPTAVKGQKLTILTLPDIKRKYQQDWGRFDHKRPGAEGLRVKLCFNIAAAVSQIHEAKHYVLVDLKPDNILVEPSSGQISIIDIDSVEVYENNKVLFRAPVSTPEYSPPEIATLDTTAGFIPETWDRFSFGVIFYQILFGIHPFAGSCKAPFDVCTEVSQMIENGLFVHGGKKAKFTNIPPLHNKFHEYPQDVKQLFLDCFVDGHSNPNARPDINAWCKVLERYLQHLPINPAAPPAPSLNKGTRYAKTQVVQTKRPVVPPSNQPPRGNTSGVKGNTGRATNTPPPPSGIPRSPRTYQAGSQPSTPFKQTFVRQTQHFLQGSVNLKAKTAKRTIVKKRYLVFLGKRYELTPMINSGLYVSAAVIVAIFFTGLYLKSVSNRSAHRAEKPYTSLALGGIFVRDVSSGKITQMQPDEVTKQTAEVEGTTADGATDVNIYDYSMYRADEYLANEVKIGNLIDDYIQKQLKGTDNFVGNLNCHLIYSVEKGRQVRLQFSRLEGTINITDSFRLQLVKVPFAPVIEEGSSKMSRAEYTFDKGINSITRSIAVRHTPEGIILPLGGKDGLLKNEVFKYLTANKLPNAQYDCKYQEIYIDNERQLTILEMKGSAKK